MTDIVERLRKSPSMKPEGWQTMHADRFEAADTIERLRAELAGLKEQEPEAAYFIDGTGCEHMSRDISAIEKNAKMVGSDPEVVYLYAAPVPAVDASALIEALEEIQRQAIGHKRSTAYNDGVNIALENIEVIAGFALASHASNPVEQETGEGK
ncbi:hypothetical protein V6767_20385 [Martelella sp. FLE1502]